MGLLNMGVHYGLRALPTDWCSAFGATMSRFSAARYPESDARARRAWMTLRPEAADPASTDAAMRRLWANVGRTMAEYSILDRVWAEGRVEIEGEQHVQALRAAKRPILWAGLHLGNWEVIGVTGIRLGYHGASLTLILDNRFDQRVADRMRERIGGRIIYAHPTSGRAIVRELRERGPMVIYIDEFIRGRVQAPAFGRPLKAGANIAYVARLAKMTRAAIVPTYCVRIDESCRFKVTFLSPVELVDSGDAAADLKTNVATLNGIIEPIIRAHLDQWFYVLDFEFDK
jgi:KDO2-lipid IV(A) lauroyltransferase